MLTDFPRRKDSLKVSIYIIIIFFKGLTTFIVIYNSTHILYIYSAHTIYTERRQERKRKRDEEKREKSM